MLSDKQVEEIHEHLDKAQNPVFFFDNDQDGLCSFLILQRYLGRGKGVAIKSYPDMDKSYFKKADELNADYIFILDKPIVSLDFFEEAEKRNIPVVWIDHHEVQVEIPKTAYYYNPSYKNGKKEKIIRKDKWGSEPVTSFCYKISKRKEDLWIAVAGCVSDAYIPDFYEDFLKEWPELGIKTKDPFDVYYKSEIGKVAAILGSGLKDKTTNIVHMLKFLVQAKSPYDVLEENPKNRLFHRRAKEVLDKYEKLMKKARSCVGKSKLLFFRYSGDLSISGELSNGLQYEYPDKFIVVAKTEGNRASLSIRGDWVKEIFLKVIAGIDGARGGGHDNAVGGLVKTDQLDEFKEKFEEVLKQ